MDCFTAEYKRGAVGGGPRQLNAAPEPYLGCFQVKIWTLKLCHAAVKIAAGGNHSVLQKSASGPWNGCAVELKRARNLPDPLSPSASTRAEEGATAVGLSNSPSKEKCFWQRSPPGGRGERVPGLTYAPNVNGHIHVAVLGAVVHGLLQGFQLGLAVAAGTERSCRRVGQVRPLSQDLLQRQNIALLLLRLSKQLTKDVPVNRSTTERGRGKERVGEQSQRLGFLCAWDTCCDVAN